MKFKFVLLPILVLQAHIIPGQTTNDPAVKLNNVREADYVWAKRIWRVIDVREKFNLPFYFPIKSTFDRKNLFEILRNGILNDKITAFETDELKDTLKKDKAIVRLIDQDTISVFEVNAQGDEYVTKKWVSDTLANEYIIQYWIKEDWFFDKQRSVMDVRIVGICPVKYDVSKEVLVPLFWIKYETSREWLNLFNSYTSRNDAATLSFDDLFIKRKFHSYIKKESNVYDREIADYAVSIDAQMESERIKEFIKNYESDMWEY